MPSNKRPRSLNYGVNKKGPKGGSKVANTIAHYKKLQERVKFEGETKWLTNALNVVLTKFKKYGINSNNI